MTTLSKSSQADRAKSTKLTDHLSRRPDRRTVGKRVGAIRQRNAAARKRYAGGLPAEKEARKQLLAQERREAREAILSRHGRRINLVALLRQRRPDGNPRWCLADPMHSPGHGNGEYDRDGHVRIVKVDRRRTYNSDTVTIKVGSKCSHVCPESGFPALPEKVRALATDGKIRQRAEWVGVLYQPEEWREVDPDPALIVKWKGIDGYYALAVWGGDAPGIMEFVD